MAVTPNSSSPWNYAESKSDVIYTPPETIATESVYNPESSTSKVPKPKSFPLNGSIYIIRQESTGLVIQLLGGEVVLDKPSSLSSMDWVCEEKNGWLGFRNAASGKYLGHDGGGKLCCRAGQQREWECFSLGVSSEHGYVLLMRHWEKLWPVTINTENKDIVTLAKVEGRISDGNTWDFIEV